MSIHSYRSLVLPNRKIGIFNILLLLFLTVNNSISFTNSDNNQKKVSDYILLLDVFSNKSDIDSMVVRIEKKYLDNN